MKAIELAKQVLEKRRQYFDNWTRYAQKIKEVAEKELGEVEVYVFGSVLKEKAHPALSDIDILVTSPNTPSKLDERAKIKAKILDNIGTSSPFEIHLANPKEHQWYKKLVDKMVKIE